MASKGYFVTAVDIDDDILVLAKNISKEYFNGKNNNIVFENKDILELNSIQYEIDVCFSNGVLEHFNDDEIIRILQLQLNFAKFVLVGIPTQFFDRDEALYGNERFMPLYYWRYLITKSGGRIIEEHSFHYMSFFEKIINIRKLGRPSPYRLLKEVLET